MRRPMIAGLPVLVRRVAPGRARPGQWLPRREARYLMAYGASLLLVQYQPHRGMYPIALCRVVDGALVDDVEFPSLWSQAMKKVSLGVDSSTPLPPLSSDSVLLKRLARLREFLSLTAYDDGSPRAPGRLWLDSDGTAYIITLFEPSAMVRARFRAAGIDDVFALADTFLGADTPPWEVDQWARDRVTAKKKK